MLMLAYVSQDCCGHDMVLKRGTQACHCVYPIKLDILLINVSSDPNWNIVLEEFAYQLGLRGSQIAPINFYVVTSSNWNISVAITPHTGKSFSEVEASEINSSLSMHRVRTNPKLVGDYKILNFTWFQPQASSQGNFHIHFLLLESLNICITGPLLLITI